MLSDYALKLFRRAVQNGKLWDSVETYLYLREIFSDPTRRSVFEKNYSTYYGFGAARLAEAWRRRYFNLLFDRKEENFAGAKLYEKLLLELEYQRENGIKVLHFSFVSKLVAFHDESRPLYDERVRHFFGLGPPEFGSKEFRISGFVHNLNEIAQRYQSWTQEGPFVEILSRMRKRCPRLVDCHNVRLIDFLVHKAEA